MKYFRKATHLPDFIEEIQNLHIIILILKQNWSHTLKSKSDEE